VKWPAGKETFPGGGETFEKTMLALRAKYAKFVKTKEGKTSEMAKSGSDEMVVG
jgi:hypothetical protein